MLRASSEIDEKYCPIFAGSATTVTMTVTSAGSAVTSVSQGAMVTLTATVAAGSTPVTVGQVPFCDAAAQRCTDIHLLRALLYYSQSRMEETLGSINKSLPYGLFHWLPADDLLTSRFNL